MKKIILIIVVALTVFEHLQVTAISKALIPEGAVDEFVEA